MKSTKNIIIAIIITIAIGILLIFAGSSPEKEEGIKLLRLVYIVLLALAGIAFLVVLVKYNQAIIRFLITNLSLVIAAVTAGLFACILFFGDWPAEIMMKVELLPSVFIASLVLVGFVLLLENIRDNNGFNVKLEISDIRTKKSRVCIGQSVAFGCFTILAIMVYFIIYEIHMIYIAWIFFVLQLELLITPLLFAKIIVFR